MWSYCRTPGTFFIVMVGVVALTACGDAPAPPGKTVPAKKVQPLVVGFDSGAEMVEGLKNGRVAGLVLQDPVQIGYVGVKTAVEHLQGNDVEKHIATDSVIVTKKTMDNPREAKLLKPDLSILDTKPTLKDPKYKIGVVPKATLHEYWKSVHAGALKASNEFNVEIKWQGPAREDDREGQINIIRTMITQKFNAIVLAPLDRDALIAPVEEAKKAGVAVIIIDSALADESNIVSYVATDNQQGGYKAGQFLGKKLNGKGNVIVLRYQAGSGSTGAREKGFLAALKKEFPDIKLLSDNQYAGPTREGALDKAKNLLTRFQNKDINGWFCPCEPVTSGVIQALEQQ